MVVEEEDWEHKVGMTGSKLGGPAGTARPWGQADGFGGSAPAGLTVTTLFLLSVKEAPREAGGELSLLLQDR